jgi:hypothetical protein
MAYALPLARGGWLGRGQERCRHVPRQGFERPPHGHGRRLIVRPARRQVDAGGAQRQFLPVAIQEAMRSSGSDAVALLQRWTSFRHSATLSSLPPSSSSRAGCLSPATRPVRALRCEPAACRRHPALASRWRGACGPTPGAGISGQDGMGWADAVGGKGRCRVGRAVTRPGPSPDPD